ncbi:putative E3 ubiquitin-protein ligase protein PFF1365c [Galleria mellonella]|uniref:E3 ubiquitin-protein ligase protein PFF1365c n=1 Tax=Galleria mellonella TaxID=7137 RepID=A0A6J3BYJ0_GALME|nr:putative E3 ubiquitin-protein ligase protein PFF1365c [Galleria mellonella]
MITKVAFVLLFYINFSSGEQIETDSPDYNFQSVDQKNSNPRNQFYPFHIFEASPDIYYGSFRRPVKPCSKFINAQDTFKDENDQRWIPTYKKQIIKPIPIADQDSFTGNNNLIYQSLKDKDFDEENSDKQRRDGDQSLKDISEQDTDEHSLKMESPSQSFYKEDLSKNSPKDGAFKNLKLDQKKANEKKEGKVSDQSDVTNPIIPFHYNDNIDKFDKNDFNEDIKCINKDTIIPQKDLHKSRYFAKQNSIYRSGANLDVKQSLKLNDDKNILIDSDNNIYDNNNTSKNVDDSSNIQNTIPQTRKFNNNVQMFEDNERKNRNDLIENTVSNSNAPEEERQFIEPTKGRGIVPMSESKMMFMENSRICYACSSTSNPTCLAPDRRTTVKYCHKGHNACVTKKFQSQGTSIIVRDCASTCDDPSLGGFALKYKSCSICHSDLCNDKNGAFSFNNQSIVLSLLIIMFIKCVV